MVSRLAVSLFASMPRVSRVGEAFSGGVVVDVTSRSKVKVTVVLKGGIFYLRSLPLRVDSLSDLCC